MKINNGNSSHHLLRGIKNFFSRDLLWKICSLAIAVFMWFLVMNTINPTEIKTFTAPITFENMEALTEKGYIVSNIQDFDSATVTIKVEASRPALDALSKAESKNSIKAKIDLSKIEIDQNADFPYSVTAAIVPSLPNSSYLYNYDISSYYPNGAEIEIDKAETRTIPVELATYGSPMSGYVAEDATSDTEEVEVTGPKSVINNVEKVVATIDITNSKETLSKDCKMTVYDTNNMALKGFIIEPNTISVSVVIKKNNAIKIEEPVTTGNLPDQLELLSIDYSPKTIDATSLNDKVPESITLPPIDLTSITKETTRAIDISGILEKAGLESKIKKINVTIKVGVKSAEDYVIQTSAIKTIGLNPNYNVSFDKDEITLEIGGASNIDISALAPNIDITNLSLGKHTVPLKLTLPANAVMSEDPVVDIEITAKSTTPVEKASEVETTPATEPTTELSEITTENTN